MCTISGNSGRDAHVARTESAVQCLLAHTQTHARVSLTFSIMHLRMRVRDVRCGLFVSYLPTRVQQHTQPRVALKANAARTATRYNVNIEDAYFCPLYVRV